MQTLQDSGYRAPEGLKRSGAIGVIGIGGIATPEDAVEFMLAGAAAVQVGTANFWDPRATEKIVDGLEGWCIDHRVKRITELIGTLQT